MYQGHLRRGLGDCPDVRAQLSDGRWSHEGKSKGRPMIDWDSDNWGNGVTYAANGSWVTDKHGDEGAEQD